MINSRPLSKFIGEMVESKHLSEFDNKDIFDLKRLLFNRKAVFFEEQFLTKVQLKELGDKLKSTPTSMLIEQDIDNSEVYSYGESWHSDRDYFKNLPTYTIFQINKLPNVNLSGDTEFIDTVSFYEYGISAVMKQTFQNLTATHEYLRQETEDIKFDNKLASKSYFRAVHPVILETTFENETAQSLFLNPAHVTRINELKDFESKAILEAIFSRLYLYTEFRYRHQWKEGSIVIWDNRLCQHRGVKDFRPDDVRQASRVVVY